MASDREVLAKTLFYEARGEEEQGIYWVAWVIKNRARMNRPYWGGSSISDVCLHNQDGHWQFECWVENNVNDPIPEDEMESFLKCEKIAKNVIKAKASADPTGGCDHYNNPAKEGRPPWTRNCDEINIIGNHTFYRSKNP